MANQFFFFKQSLFMEIVIGIQKYLSTYHYTFRLPNIFGSFFSLVAYHLANVNGLIQKGF